MVRQSRRVCQLLERKITPSGEFSCSPPVDGDLPGLLLLAGPCSVRSAGITLGLPTRQGDRVRVGAWTATDTATHPKTAGRPAFSTTCAPSRPRPSSGSHMGGSCTLF